MKKVSYSSIILFFLIGLAIRFVGSLFKIMHWPHAMTLLMIATFIIVLAIILLVIKVYKNKEALNQLLNNKK